MWQRQGEGAGWRGHRGWKWGTSGIVSTIKKGKSVIDSYKILFPTIVVHHPYFLLLLDLTLKGKPMSGMSVNCPWNLRSSGVQHMVTVTKISHFLARSVCFGPLAMRTWNFHTKSSDAIHFVNLPDLLADWWDHLEGDTVWQESSCLTFSRRTSFLPMTLSPPTQHMLLPSQLHPKAGHIFCYPCGVVCRSDSTKKPCDSKTIRVLSGTQIPTVNNYSHRRCCSDTMITTTTTKNPLPQLFVELKV